MWSLIEDFIRNLFSVLQACRRTTFVASVLFGAEWKCLTTRSERSPRGRAEEVLRLSSVVAERVIEIRLSTKQN
jgi:hypothetical protein